MTSEGKPDKSANSSEVSSARITAPKSRLGLLRRDRLVDFLDQNIGRKLVLISAPAGYGKTALLITFLQVTDLPVAWYSLEETDRELSVLITHLLAAIQQNFPAFQSESTRLLTSDGVSPEQVASSLARDIRDRIDEHFVIILDDFQQIGDSDSITEFINALIEHLPDEASLIISGRTMPDLNYLRLTAQQQIAGLGAGDLGFTAAEAKSLVEQLGNIALSNEQIERLVAETEGWITGIILGAQTMQQRPAVKMIEARSVEEAVEPFLAAEVLDPQPDPLRRFLMESAVLPEITADLSDAVLERSDSAKMLQQAEDRRLFVTALGDEPKSYRYHQLFRDFLTDRLRDEDPRRLAALAARLPKHKLLEPQFQRVFTLYEEFPEESPVGLTPQYLEEHIGPYLNAIAEIQKIINDARGQSPPEVVIKEIRHESPVNVSLSGAADAIQLIRNIISPWRRKHSSTMALLLERQKQVEIEIGKADVLDKRAHAHKDRAEAEKLLVDAAKQHEVVKKLQLENDERRLELQKARIELALNVLDRIAPDVSETERIEYLLRLLPPLEKLISSNLHMTARDE